MIRLNKILSWVKKDLDSFSVRGVSTPEIIEAINKAQESLVMTEDLLYAKITIPIVAGTNVYPLVYGTSPNTQSIIKKVKSVQFPSNWQPIQWRTSQQFDSDQDVYSDLDYPQFATIRNGALEFWAAPQDIPGVNLYLACLLSRQTQDCSDTYEPEIPQQYDSALRYYADWYLLPINDPNRDRMLMYFEAERRKFEGTFNNTDSYSRNPDPNW
ncbi:MAG: phage adaptor protein [Nitrospiria bacterium]